MSSSHLDNETLKESRRSFFAELPNHLTKMEEEWTNLQKIWDPQAATSLSQNCHNLSISSLSLGFTRAGIALQGIENALKDLSRLNHPTSAQIDGAYKIIFEKAAIISRALGLERNSVPQQEEIVSSSQNVGTGGTLENSRSRLLVFILEQDVHLAQEIAQQIVYFGYPARSFNTLADLQKTMQTVIPSALILGISTTESGQAEFGTLREIARNLPKTLPLIFISNSSDINIRLESARSGGKAFFTKPVNLGSLIENLDHHLSVEKKPPYRIMIVDDDHVQATVNALHLKRAGMETHIITNPLIIIQSMLEFNPDLILLDIYMPECSGLELAVIIRQIEAFVSIPIVFLSSESDRARQLEAVGVGGDDFLTKPIKPEYLISAITSRVVRYRQLRNLMTRDSLTGLLNHTTLKERLAQEINRASRYNRALSFVMLDLDIFKKVNDSFGHSAGDRVLKSLASMLINRLRSTDIIGRYGGEEFGIILPHTCLEDAVNIMEDLRINFEHIHHQAGATEFTVTFSCGVASFPECSMDPDLADLADKALYLAKANGRNRVESYLKREFIGG